MKAVLLSLLAITQSALAGVAFKCEGEKSRFEVVQGYYSGEASDSITLKSSSVYRIYNRHDYGRPLRLPRVQNSKKVGIFKPYPIQFVAKQENDLGEATTTFAIPMGVMSGHVGRAFEALLLTSDEMNLLDCEIVESVDLR